MPIAFLALLFLKLVYNSSMRICCALCVLLVAFPVEFFGKNVLLKSVFLKLDNCLLISNPLVGRFLCNTVSKLPVQMVLNDSTGVMHHLKSNRFMASSNPLRSASPRELSPIKMLSLKLFPKSRSLPKNVGGVFFNVVLTIDLMFFSLRGT